MGSIEFGTLEDFYRAVISNAIAVMKTPSEPQTSAQPLWLCTKNTFNLTSTSAQQLCKGLGFDPDYMVPAYDLSNHEQCPVCGAEIQDSYEQFLEHSNRQSERDAAAGVRS